MKTDRPTIPLKGSKSLRTGRRSIPVQIYLLTTATFNREPFLQNPEAAAIVLNSFKYLEDQDGISLEAAVIMPDHAHIARLLYARFSYPSMRGSLKAGAD